MLSLSGRLGMNYEACAHRYEEAYEDNEYEVIVSDEKIERLREAAVRIGKEDQAEFLIAHLCNMTPSMQEFNIDVAIGCTLFGELDVVGYYEDWR